MKLMMMHTGNGYLEPSQRVLLIVAFDSKQAFVTGLACQLQGCVDIHHLSHSLNDDMSAEGSTPRCLTDMMNMIAGTLSFVQRALKT